MGTTIGYVLISYDVNTLHSLVKADMEKLGYNDHFNYPNDQRVHYLPNTTLWHPKKSSDQAIAEIKATCKNRQVVLEKAVAVYAAEFVGT